MDQAYRAPSAEIASLKYFRGKRKMRQKIKISIANLVEKTKNMYNCFGGDKKQKRWRGENDAEHVQKNFLFIFYHHMLDVGCF